MRVVPQTEGGAHRPETVGAGTVTVRGRVGWCGMTRHRSEQHPFRQAYGEFASGQLAAKLEMVRSSLGTLELRVKVVDLAAGWENCPCP